MSQLLLAAGELHNGQVPLGEAVAFWILGPLSLAGAMGTVLLRNAVHSALSLAGTMMCLGMFYLIEQGPFLGFVQIIVYTGAIMILFLFVLMLVGRDSSDSLVETLRGQRLAAALFGIGFALLVALSVGRAFKGSTPANLNGTAPTAGDPSSYAGGKVLNSNGSNVNSIADLLFTRYLFEFELTSALLIVAAVGAMILAHVEREEPKLTQRALARARIRSGRPQPLPGPGVLSSHNAIGTPALLPDGSISEESVMSGLQIGSEYENVPALPGVISEGEGER
ncbi:NADH-quinone oxidoreductase subunit J [Jatrophihabitans sp.]|uniref:NADH-quinone oxidoreductase subunit J n=1 Tax=Jatrophihabitans sp. TaxID=1932789 RepID=UPI0030C751D1|nr:NADH-ubiquinone/plastoquinone oxidoreductase chain 6 [Jatrophihabitans sp.]